MNGQRLFAIGRPFCVIEWKHQRVLWLPIHSVETIAYQISHNAITSCNVLETSKARDLFAHCFWPDLETTLLESRCQRSPSNCLQRLIEGSKDDDYVFCVNIQFLIRPFFMFTVFLICIFGVEISILVAYKLQIKVKVNKVT